MSEPSMQSINHLRGHVQRQAAESDAQYEARLFQSLCSLVDSVGVEAVYDRLSALARAMPLEQAKIAGQAMRQACMRTGGVAFGQRYDAHMMMLPLIVRGPSPSVFPSVIDRFTCIRVHDALRSILAFKFQSGHLYYPLPLTHAYTMDEFEQESILKVHEILKSAFITLGAREIRSAAKFINVLAERSHAGVQDSQLVNMALPRIGQVPDALNRAGIEGHKNAGSGGERSERSQGGEWMSMRLLPVVLMVPQGLRAPRIDDLGKMSIDLGRVISFSGACQKDAGAAAPGISIAPASATKGVGASSGGSKPGSHGADGADGAADRPVPGGDTGEKRQAESVGLEVLPMGLYDMEEAPTQARVRMVYDKVLLEITQRAVFFDQEQFQICLRYSREDNNLQIFMEDDDAMHQMHLLMPPGMMVHQFIENCHAELVSLGFRVTVDMGDGMIRIDYGASRACH